MRDFAKETLVENLYFLIKKEGKKIGEFEEEAGVSAGYISRMSKDINTKPGIEFVVKASNILNVSLDTLLGVDLSHLSGTEQYALKFLQKLKNDTEAEKLTWEKETADVLNATGTDDEGYPLHPLFSWETFERKSSATGSEEQVNSIVFNSRSFGCYTSIHDDCYKIEMKNKTMLYLMDIQYSDNNGNGSNTFAKEIWLYKYAIGCQFLCSNRDVHFSRIVDYLFSSVKEYLKHPQLKSDFRDAIDAFMNDDFTYISNGQSVSQTDVPFDEEIPF